MGKVWSEKDVPCPEEIAKINVIKEGLASQIEITDDMIIKWGSSFSREEYLRMESFYNSMVEKNIIETPQDEEYLKKASVISLKIDKALEDNDADTATKLGNLFSKYMADMKQRAVDRKGGDGKDDEKEFHNFSSVFADIERDDFIPP